MKTYSMGNVDPLISNVLIRLHIDQYFDGLRSGLQESHPSLMSIMAWAQLSSLPVTVGTKDMMDLELRLERLKATAARMQMADVNLIESWIRHMEQDQPEAMFSEQIFAPEPRTWSTADAGVGFMLMLGWAKKLPLMCDGAWQEELSELPLEDTVYCIAFGQLTDQNNHSFMEMQDIEVVQSIALRQYFDSVGKSNHQKAREAILVLCALSELWFKLRNGLSPKLTSAVISAGSLPISHATAESANDS